LKRRENKRKQNETTAGNNNNKKKKKKKKNNIRIGYSWPAQLLKTLGYHELVPLTPDIKVLEIISRNLTGVNDDELLRFDETAWMPHMFLQATPEGGNEGIYWLLKLTINKLRDHPQEKVVYVVSGTTSTTAVATRLTKALEVAVRCGKLDDDHGLIVKHYQDKDQIGDWNVLVSHEQSLERWCFDDVTVMVIDEVTATPQQEAEAVELKKNDEEEHEQPTRESVNQLAYLIKRLYNQIRWFTIGDIQRSSSIRICESHYPEDTPITEAVLYLQQPSPEVVPQVVQDGEWMYRGKIERKGL
jgi:hypothetical protein